MASRFVQRAQIDGSSESKTADEKMFRRQAEAEHTEAYNEMALTHETGQYLFALSVPFDFSRIHFANLNQNFPFMLFV